MRTIDADELKQTFYDNKKYHEEKHKDSLLIGFDFDKMINVIDDASTINPEDLRPKGKWIKTGKISVRCSACNYLPAENDYNYCPNCGAKMGD